MKMSKRIAVLVLLTVTVIYAVTLYQSIQAYNAWKEAKIEWYCREIGGTKEDWEGLLDFHPFIQSSFGKPCLTFGIALGLCYMFVFPIVTSKDDKTRLATFFLGAIVAGSILLVPQVFADTTIHA